jgi:hypothetical protein
MVTLARGIFEGGRDVLRLEQRVVPQDFLARGARRQEVENFFDANAQPAKCRGGRRTDRD